MRTITAVFENGVFRPEVEVPLSQGARVQVLIPDAAHATLEQLRARYPGIIGVLSNEAAEEMRRITDEEFGRIEPDDWK